MKDDWFTIILKSVHSFILSNSCCSKNSYRTFGMRLPSGKLMMTSQDNLCSQI